MCGPRLPNDGGGEKRGWSGLGISMTEEKLRMNLRLTRLMKAGRWIYFWNKFTMQQVTMKNETVFESEVAIRDFLLEMMYWGGIFSMLCRKLFILINYFVRLFIVVRLSLDNLNFVCVYYFLVSFVLFLLFFILPYFFVDIFFFFL